MKLMSKCFYFSKFIRYVKFSTYQISDLPRLPLPNLNDTLNKYLKSIRPLLTNDEYDHTIKIVQYFGKESGVGEKLQTILKNKADEEKNWLYGWWLNMGYLSGRYPLLINSNPGLLFPDIGKKKVCQILSAIIKFKRQLDAGLMPRETVKGIPLSMSQYPKMFNTCRVPGKIKDYIIANTITPSLATNEYENIGERYNLSNSIVVLMKNHIWLFEIIGQDDRPLDVVQIQNNIRKIIEESKNKKDIQYPVNILTTENRTTWASIYEKLKNNRHNAKIFRAIQECCLVLCIDDVEHSPQSKDEVANNILHGRKSYRNTCNRWFDKTLQIIIDSNGHVGLNFEHSLAEGPPYVSLMDFILKHCNDSEDESDGPPSSAVTEPTYHKFEVEDDGVKQAIEAAKNRVDSFIDDLDLRLYSFPNFGKEKLKALKISPDAFVQVALQLAYYRLNNKPCATYESASTRKFDMGRTETIRSCTPESFDFSEAMKKLSGKGNSGEKLNLLNKALAAHKANSIDASNAQGIDRHLLGLKLVAIEEGMDLPKLFMDMAYTKSNHFQLSTSQVPSTYDATMFYGPGVPDGYGFCYNPRGRHVNYAVSSVKSSPLTDTPRLSSHFDQAMVDMVELLETDG